MKVSFDQESGMAIPAALIMIMLIASMTAILSNLSTHNLTQIEISDAKDGTYLAAEGAVSKQISEMNVLSLLWSERVNLSTVPAGYTQYFPSSYAASNSIPSCTGLACQRSLYPLGGGLIKNLGPVNGAGDSVDSSYAISSQLNPESPPDADVTLNGIKAWTQVERLDESFPSASTVGSNLTNSVAEGGNARIVRYRITGYALKNLKGRKGYATVVTVVEMPSS